MSKTKKTRKSKRDQLLTVIDGFWATPFEITERWLERFGRGGEQYRSFVDSVKPTLRELARAGDIEERRLHRHWINGSVYRRLGSA